MVNQWLIFFIDNRLYLQFVGFNSVKLDALKFGFSRILKSSHFASGDMK